MIDLTLVALLSFVGDNFCEYRDLGHDTYKSLLNVGTADNQELDTTLRIVEDGAGNDSDLEYYGANDQAQGTAFQRLGITINNSNDNSVSGFLRLFNPSSTTFVKHFIATSQEIIDDTYSMQQYTAGYFNTTSAIDEIQFKMSSGDIDAGTIKLYGIKDS